MIRNAYGCRMALMCSMLTATLVKNVLAKSLLATLVTLLLCAGAQAKQTDEELAKKTQNPVANLISIPSFKTI